MVDESQGGGQPAHRASDGLLDAQELLELARRDAAAIRADAERQAAKRELEAELLIAKARRVLVAAEEKAAVIIATARERSGAPGSWGDEAGPIGRVIAPGATRLHGGPVAARIDRMVASAIAQAVDEAFPLDDVG